MVNLAGAIENPPIHRAVEESKLADFHHLEKKPEMFQKSYDAAIGFLDTAITDNKTKSPPDQLLQDIDTTAQRIKNAKDLAKTPKPPEEGTYDKNTGKWTYKKDASAPIEEGYESDLYPDMIQALDQITGPKAGDAKTASDNFKNQLGVYVGGSPNPITYNEWRTQWEPKVKLEASKIAVDKNNPTPAELRQADINLRKTENVSFYVVYPKGAETLPVETIETKRIETAKEAGKYVINHMIEDAKGKKGVEANYSFGALTEFYILLREAIKNNDARRIPILTSLVSSAARNCMNTNLDLFADPTGQDFTKRLELNTNFYNAQKTEPVRLAVLELLRQHVRSEELANLTENFNPHELVAFAISLRNIVDHKSYVLRNLGKLKPGTISEDSKTILKTLADSDKLPTFRNAMLDQLGIVNPGIIESRLAALPVVGDKIPKLITSGIEAFLQSKNDNEYHDAEIQFPADEKRAGFNQLIDYDKWLSGGYASENIMQHGEDLLQNNYKKALVFALALMLIQPSLGGGLDEDKQSSGG